MKKGILLGVSILGLSVYALVSSNTALAYKGDPNVKGPNYDPQRHEAMTKAFETKDYDAWLALKRGKRIAEKVTRDTFWKLIEARSLMLQGKVDEANKIREELGLGVKRQDGSGYGAHGFMNK